jgi:NDP-sugar pyrophosphorylase family protein
MSKEHAIVLAGGLGRRLSPYTNVLPKPLLPIGHVPILEVIIRQLAVAGVGTVHLAVGYLAELIQSYFGDGSKLGVRIHYYREPEPLGTAAPVRFVIDHWASAEPVPERFVVMNGDLLMDVRIADLIARHRPGSLSVLVAQKRVKVDLGVLVMGEAGEVSDYVEKPEYQYHVSTGVYVFSRELVDGIPAGQRLDLPDLVKQMLADRRPVVPVHLSSVGALWLDLGRLEDYEEGRRLFEESPERFSCRPL